MRDTRTAAADNQVGNGMSADPHPPLWAAQLRLILRHPICAIFHRRPYWCDTSRGRFCTMCQRTRIRTHA